MTSIAFPIRGARISGMLGLAFLACAGCGGSTGLRDTATSSAIIDAARFEAASTEILAVCRDQDLSSMNQLGFRISGALTELRSKSASPDAFVPPEALGAQFVLDSAGGEYVRDQNASTDATSAAFALYRISPQTGRPATPLSPAGVYRLRAGTPVSFAVERFSPTFGGMADTLGSGIQIASGQSEATLTLPSPPRVHITESLTVKYIEGYHEWAFIFDTEMTWGTAQKSGLIAYHIQVGDRFANALANSMVVGADTIRTTSWDADKRFRVFLNGTEISTDQVTVGNGVKPTGALGAAVSAALDAMGTCGGLVNTLLAPIRAYPRHP